MRSVSSAKAARNFSTIRESVLAPGAEPVAVTHDNTPEVVMLSVENHGDLVHKSRFSGKLAGLPEDDLSFLAAIAGRNET